MTGTRQEGAPAGGASGTVSPAVRSIEIDLSRVEKRFPTPDGMVHAVAQTDIAVKQQEFVVLLGPSGCGKTTILRMIAGLLQPSAGTIRVAGRDLWLGARRDKDALGDLGIVFQDANLFPWYSIERNVALPLELRGVGRNERLERARALCDLVGIRGFEKRWPRELSGGMRQRAAIARALSYDPKILLMDEPFGALDAMTRDTMNVEIQRLWMSQKSTVVFVTHSISEAVFLADRIILLSPRPGRVRSVTEVTFPRPRDMVVQTRPEFQDIVRHLREELEAME